ncbi:MAG: class I SAM-dependent methyltransferase [Acidimicrobiales bacterium]
MRGIGSDHLDYQRSFYDEHYPRHAAAVREQLAHPLFRSWNDRLARRVLELGAGRRRSEEPLRVYEAGCGEGLIGSALTRVAAERGLPVAYTGSDLSEAALEVAEGAVDGNFLVGDATAVTAELPVGSQDLVVAKNLLHHIDDPADFLAAAARAVGPGGRVVIVEARLACVPFFLATLIFAYERERYFFKGRRRNLRAISAAGLRIDHEERFSALPYEYALAIRADVFRRLLSTESPATIDRFSRLDDRLAVLLPWLAHYDIWLTSPSQRDA